MCTTNTSIAFTTSHAAMLCSHAMQALVIMQPCYTVTRHAAKLLQTLIMQYAVSGRY